EIIEIIQRAQSGFVGTLKEVSGSFIVVPDNFKVSDITLAPNTEYKNHLGEKVFVEIVEYTPHLTGTLKKYLGKADSNDANMNGIALEQGFDYSFPAEVEQEAQRLEEQGMSDNDIQNRRDMRDELTFTIDPEDAKDFDDA